MKVFIFLMLFSGVSFSMTPSMKIANDARLCIADAKGDKYKIEVCNQKYYNEKKIYDLRSDNVYDYNKFYYGDNEGTLTHHSTVKKAN